MKIRFKETELNKIIGVIWFLVAITFSILIFIFRFLTPIILFMYSINIILDIFLGARYLRAHKRNYIIINQHSLIIQELTASKKHEIEIKDLESGNIIGDKLYITCRNGKEYKISLLAIKAQDRNNFITYLMSLIKIKKGFIE